VPLAKNNFNENSMLDSHGGLIKALNASSAAAIVFIKASL
jgi:hypothetical protein